MPKAAASSDQITVEYTKYPGIVTRIIERADFERMGADLDTQEFSVAQGYAKDATGWPEEAIAYFRSDEEFTVRTGASAEKALDKDSPKAPAGTEGNNLPSGSTG